LKLSDIPLGSNALRISILRRTKNPSISSLPIFVALVELPVVIDPAQKYCGFMLSFAPNQLGQEGTCKLIGSAA
jgi:hypothetical protein